MGTPAPPFVPSIVGNGAAIPVWLDFVNQQYWAAGILNTPPVTDDPAVTPAANPKPGFFLDNLGLNCLTPNPCIRFVDAVIAEWNAVINLNSGFSLVCQVNMSDPSEGSILTGFATFNQQTANGYQALALNLDMDIPGNTFGGNLTWDDLTIPENLPIHIGDGSIDNPFPPGNIVTMGVTVRNGATATIEFWVEGVLQGSVTTTKPMADLFMCETVKEYTPPTFNGVTNGNNLGAVAFIAIMPPVDNPTLVFGNVNFSRAQPEPQPVPLPCIPCCNSCCVMPCKPGSYHL